jgi:hypothetical protein
MKMFEVYTKEVKIKIGDKEETYLLKPLSGKFYPKFSLLLSKFQKVTSTENGVDLEKVDSSTFGIAHELCLETMKKSYPDQKEESLDEFVTQNLFSIIPALIEVNLNTTK